MAANTHRDSVDYWKRMTEDGAEMVKAHPTARRESYLRYLDILALSPGQRLLDIGIGFGRFVPDYVARGVRVSGVDLDPLMIAAAREGYGPACHDLVCCPAEGTPFQEASFDRIVCWGAFDEMDQARALREINRLLAIGGVALVTGKNSLYEFDDDDAYQAEIGARAKGHPNQFTHLSRLNLDAYGFELLEGHYYRRRGDWVKGVYQTASPLRFYEYGLFLRKTRDIRQDTAPACGPVSSSVSLTFVERFRGKAFHPELGVKPGVRPLYLSGVYRSGTTLLAQILGAHPNLSLCYDLVKFTRFCLDRFSPLSGRFEELIRSVDQRLGTRWGTHFNVERAVALAEAQGTQSGYAQVYDALMTEIALADKPGATRWGEKVAVMWSRIPDFLNMFPDGQVVHIFRDPRDTAASYKKITYEPGQTYLDAAFNCLHAAKSLDLYRECYGRERVYCVRLEDLLERPEEEARRLCEFLGEDYAPAMLDPSFYKDKTGQPWKVNSGFLAEASGIHKDYRRWTKSLDSAEVFFVELVAGDVMRQLGYERSGIGVSRDILASLQDYLEDPFLAGRFNDWQVNRIGAEGYRTDPVEVEQNIVRDAGS